MKKQEISFGVFNSELTHQEISIPKGFEATIDGNKIILTKIESDDGRISKEIIKYLEQTVPHNHRDEVLKSKEWIVWLEKQANSTVNDEPKFKADAEMSLRFAQKPIEWSEKDEKMLNDIISDVKFEGYNNDLLASSYRKINWLNSLKDNIKFNYSKDDKMLDKIMQIVSNYWNSISDSNIDENEEVESCYNWLKSLK